MTFDRDVCVIGGGGHVGLPFALMTAGCGLRTVIYDIDAPRLETIRSGRMPFREEGGAELLTRTLRADHLEVSDSAEVLSRCRFLLLIIGTPVDTHLNPSFTVLDRVMEACRPHLQGGQILIVRSTVYPGTSARLQRRLQEAGLRIGVACCPERVAQGASLREFGSLPQIVSAFDAETLGQVKTLFARFSPELVELEPLEAELCKLMTNAWRYIQFAAVNQFYMIASEHGVDFQRVLHGCRHHYPRMAMMPGPGLSAGPCLVKDTMQLAAFSHNAFMLGHSAMLVNEGLPAHLVELARRETDLAEKTVGILGMAFKADSDDARDSLSYKLKRLLALEAKAVLCTDPFVPDPRLVPLDRVLREADVLFVGAPHAAYRDLEVPGDRLIIDVWSCLKQASKGD